jgi:hypothetical protein
MLLSRIEGGRTRFPLKTFAMTPGTNSQSIFFDGCCAVLSAFSGPQSQSSLFLSPICRISSYELCRTQNGDPFGLFNVSYEAVSFLEKMVITWWHVGDRRFNLRHEQRQLVVLEALLCFSRKRVKLADRRGISNSGFPGDPGEIRTGCSMTGSTADRFITFIVENNDG